MGETTEKTGGKAGESLVREEFGSRHTALKKKRKIVRRKDWGMMEVVDVALAGRFAGNMVDGMGKTSALFALPSPPLRRGRMGGGYQLSFSALVPLAVKRPEYSIDKVLHVCNMYVCIM